MKAQILEQTGPILADSRPLRLATLPDPVPRDGEVLIQVHACGVCHTELDEIEGRRRPLGCRWCWGIRLWVKSSR